MLRRSLREIREAERSRISRDLHDVVLQDLTYALQEVQLSRRLSRTEAPGWMRPWLPWARSVRGLRSAVYDLSVEAEDRGTVRAFPGGPGRVEQGDVSWMRVRDWRYAKAFRRSFRKERSRDLLRIVQEALVEREAPLGGPARARIAAGTSPGRLVGWRSPTTGEGSIRRRYARRDGYEGDAGEDPRTGGRTDGSRSRARRRHEGTARDDCNRGRGNGSPRETEADRASGSCWWMTTLPSGRA